MTMLSKIFGDPNERFLRKLQPMVEKINQLEPKFEHFSDEQLKEKTEQFKRMIQGTPFERASLEILPEAFALVREAAKRTLGQRHFDVQLIGGIVLHQGKIAEMKTGEGKTLAATLAVYLNALTGQGVHIVTVNDYLARRDTNWMGPIYHLLGLSCACLQHEKAYLYQPEKVDRDEVTIEMENLKEVPRKEAYAADITYGTNNEFGFDYLRDNMAQSPAGMVQRQPYYAIVDEVDSILIDEARTPLIISMPDVESTKMYDQFARIIPQLKENTDYNIDEKMRSVTLTEEGIAKVEKILGLGNIYQEAGIRYVHHLEQALRAQVLFQKDRDYVVKEGQVIIVDEFTGRLMPGRRFAGGLHQALEAKERVQVQAESRTLATITFQNYFRLYQKLAGMTGTALTSAEEFSKVYGLDVVVIPTNKPMIREDLPDSIYKTTQGKFQAVVREVKKRHQKSQPVLVGTVSIEKNELLSALLKKEGIPHQVLNAKHHEEEAKIIAQAGRLGAVTVATNMAGRGVDIILGGRSDQPSRPRASLGGASQGRPLELGGLHVIGTERHEARRIDNQLRGRSGRQGDPGSSQFFVSMEDDLMRIFGGERIKTMMERLKVPEDQPIENQLVSKAIESAQAKIEGYNFDIRKHVLEYDDVMNKQREVIYARRRDILETPISSPSQGAADSQVKGHRSQILDMIKDEIKKIVEFHTADPQIENWHYEEIYEIFKSLFSVSEQAHQKLLALKDQEKISQYCFDLAEQAYQAKEKEIGQENMGQVERFVLLRTIDALWMDHLDLMEHLRDSVRLRAYGQKDPLVEYKNEGHRLFQKLLAAIQSNVVGMIYKVTLAPSQSYPERAIPSQGPGGIPTKLGTKKVGLPAEARRGRAKVGRNDPCPCGKINPKTGQPIKYKKCCYPKYG